MKPIPGPAALLASHPTLNPSPATGRNLVFLPLPLRAGTASESKFSGGEAMCDVHVSIVMSGPCAWSDTERTRSRAISDSPLPANHAQARQTCPTPHVRVAGPNRARPFNTLITRRQRAIDPRFEHRPDSNTAPPSRSPPLLRAQPGTPHMAGQGRCMSTRRQMEAAGSRPEPVR